MPALEARGVWKTYDRVRYVLQNIHLTVNPGDVTVLMGRSGSGKTTLLNILAGLETPTKGHVIINNHDMATLNEDDRTHLRRDAIGIVFQRFHLIPELTLLENVQLPMQLANRENATQRAHQLLEFFGLHTHTQAYPSTLSGGETQRAAIARALGNEPTVILADEPTANLDEANAKNALNALQRVAKKTNTAVLIATHDPLAQQAGDTTLNLIDGQLHHDNENTPDASKDDMPEIQAEALPDDEAP